MSKYHISPQTGRPNKCYASTRPCPIGGEGEHYSTREEAKKAIEEKAAKEFPTAPVSLKKVSQPLVAATPVAEANDEEWNARMEATFGKRYASPLRFLSSPMSPALLREVLKKEDDSPADEVSPDVLGLAAGKVWREGRNARGGWQEVSRLAQASLERAHEDEATLARMTAGSTEKPLMGGRRAVMGEHYNKDLTDLQRHEAVERTFQEAGKEGLLPKGLSYEFSQENWGSGPMMVINVYGAGREAGEAHDRDMLSAYGWGVKKALEDLANTHNSQAYDEGDATRRLEPAGIGGFRPVVWLND